jgi:hypothetical protein
MNKIKITLLSLAAVVGLLTFAPNYANATPASEEIKKGVKVVGGEEVCKDATGAVVDCFSQQVKTIVNILFYIIGVLSVIVIIFGGIRYVTSTGDSSRVKAAKDTVTYAVIGLIVALLAYAIVNFVLTNL